MAEIGNFSALTPTTTYASFNSPYYAPIGSTGGGSSITAGAASVVCDGNANSVTTTATAIVNNIQGTGNYIANTTGIGAKLFIGTADGQGDVSNTIYAQTSTLSCQYNLTCQLLNGLAPPVVYGARVYLTAGNLTTTFNLPPLSAGGYTWVANVTPFVLIVGANPTWSCQVAADVLTVSINTAQANDIQFNLIASAYK
jgi:hypothetical protein